MWQEDQKFESDWWGDCRNTYGEETKQLTYAYKMGLRISPYKGQWPIYNMSNKSVIDIGGGPCSMLLKCINIKNPTIVDPCLYPSWVYTRYSNLGIKFNIIAAEYYISTEIFDECWIYNVLQHVKDPELIISNAKKYCKLIRIFEWIDIPAHPGHPHELKEGLLNSWLGTTGQTEQLNQNGCIGRAYFASIHTC